MIALQPAEMLHVLGPSGVKAASSGISLQHTQQLVLGSLAFMVVFLHWLDEVKAAAGIGLANRKPCTVSQPACRNHAVGCRFTPSATTSIVVFRRRPHRNVRSRLHYSSGGVGSIRQRRPLPAISGRREDFPQPAVRCGTANFQHMRVKSIVVETSEWPSRSCTVRMS